MHRKEFSVVAFGETPEFGPACPWERESGGVQPGFGRCNGSAPRNNANICDAGASKEHAAKAQKARLHPESFADQRNITPCGCCVARSFVGPAGQNGPYCVQQVSLLVGQAQLSVTPRCVCACVKCRSVSWFNCSFLAVAFIIFSSQGIHEFGNAEAVCHPLFLFIVSKTAKPLGEIFLWARNFKLPIESFRCTCFWQANLAFYLYFLNDEAFAL